MNKLTIDKLQAILDCAALYGRGSSCRVKTREVQSTIQNIQLCGSGYAEPGYDDPESGIIAFGNWNTITRWNPETRESKTIDSSPAKLAELLEKLGVAIEWQDEWTTCDDCGKAIRTEPDSYAWSRSYVQTDCGYCCHECVSNDPESYLESIEGNCDTCLTLDDINPADHGYVLLEADLENGFHPGQNANPRVIGKSLKAFGVSRFLFKLDSTGQFDISFSVWVHQDELDGLDRDEWDMSPKDGPSVSDGLRRALQAAASIPPAKDGGITVVSCDASTGTASARVVSPQDFINGKALS